MVLGEFEIKVEIIKVCIYLLFCFYKGLVIFWRKDIEFLEKLCLLWIVRGSILYLYKLI